MPSSPHDEFLELCALSTAGELTREEQKRLQDHLEVCPSCREAVKQQRPLLDLLAENAQIGAHLDRAALARLCDPANYLGQSGVMVDRVLATLR